jgi:glycerate 2-kinase
MTLASDALSIARAGIRAADPARAVARSLERVRGGIRVGGRTLRPGSGGSVRVVAIGKAAGAMADAVARRVPDVDGWVAVPRGYPAPEGRFELVRGEHPVPGAGSFSAGRRLTAHLAALPPGDVVVFLLSGGGSATVECPLPGLTDALLARSVRALLGSGAPIGEMNTVRRHLSALKGGRLAVAVGSRPAATLALSDVVGDAPEDIASGPTVADPTSFRDAVRVANGPRLRSTLPPLVRRYLEQGARGQRPESPKPGDPALAGKPFVLGATNRTARDAAAAEARRRGYLVREEPVPITGPTAPAARRFAQRLLRHASGRRPFALVAGGETTVELGPHPGRGGRNQEFALVVARRLAGREALVLSAGTDGIDGPTDAAGGWVDGRTAERARRLGVDLEGALRHHAAYDALLRLGSLWRPGPTGTNVTDLHVGLTRPGPVSRGRAGSSPRRAAPSSRRRRS